MKKLIVGISAADGVCMGRRALELLREMPEVETHLVMSRAAERNFRLECNIDAADIKALADCCYDPEDMAAAIASGSFITEGMLVAPCSMKTLSAIATGYADTLLVRAADVCLKENRRVVLMPRETPLGRIHLRNLLAAAEAGCAIVPPMMTFYNRPETLSDQINHVVGKALMQFGLTPPCFRPWTGDRILES